MMGIPAMTGHRAVTIAGDVNNKTLLITGAAGRVGFYATQWAKHMVATVIATASSEKSIESCKSAGADLVIPHLTENSVEQILEFTGGKKIDQVVEGDFAANLPFVLDFLKMSGTIACYASTSNTNPTITYGKMMSMDLDVRMVMVYAMPDSAKKHATDDITEMLAQDKLINRVAAVYSLVDIARAHESIERGGNYGSVIVTI